jgi:alkylhydroperoxidase/carboxymuconolactone decarboxylase family protein YurZ
MSEHPLKIYVDLNPKLLSLVNNNRTLALGDGALSRKVKLLIAMVLDAVHGASDGVQALAREAKSRG